MARALDLGVTHFDTSNAYGAGSSEEVIGRFFKADPSRRGRVVLATKVGITRKPELPFNNDPAYMRECLEASLMRLGVDHIDLYYVHRREQSRPVEDVMEALVRFKEEGKIGAIGLSEIAPATLERAVAIHPVAAVQSEYSLWTRLPELGLLQGCARNGAALMAFSPLARGMLTASPPELETLSDKEFRRNNPRFTSENFAYNMAYIRRFADYAADHGHAPESLAIAWVLHRAPEIIALPGTRSAEHLAADALGGAIRLTPEQMTEIETILPVGFAAGARYSPTQNLGPESYC